MSDQYPILITSISSIIAGSIARLFVHPIDTLKAKLQVQQASLVSHKITIRSTVRQTLAEEGARGLYRGFFVATAGSAPGVCVYMSAYEFAKKYLLQSEAAQKSTFWAHFCSGIFAETVSCAIFVPIDVVKERLQVQSNLNIYHYKGGIDAFKIILNTEGLRGIYRAYGATVCSFGPFSALYFMFYEKFKYWTVGSNKEIGFWPSLTCSAAAGSISSVITNPLDMAKVRMQCVRASQNSEIKLFKYKNMFHGIWLILMNEGFFALFQGSLARILFHTPNVAIMMGTTEYIRAFLEKSMHNK